MKVVINDNIGGFGLSKVARARLLELGCEHVTLYTSDGRLKDDLIIDGTVYWYHPDKEHRDCKHLVQVVEELGASANGECAGLKIVEIPDDVNFVVCEGEDGREWIAEQHRVWS